MGHDFFNRLVSTISYKNQYNQTVSGRNMIKNILLIGLLVLTAPAFAEEQTFKLSAEQEKMVFQTANEISECSGKMYALSELLNVMGKENASGHFQELGNGWYIAAAYTLLSLGAINDWQNAMTYAEERAKSFKKQTLSNFELTPDNEIEKQIEKLTEELTTCKLKWEEFQIKQVEEVRQKIYKAEENVEK